MCRLGRAKPRQTLLSLKRLVIYWYIMRLNRHKFVKPVFAWLLALAFVLAPPIKVIAHGSDLATAFSDSAFVLDIDHIHHHHDSNHDEEPTSSSHDVTDHSHDFGVRLMPTQPKERLVARDWSMSLPDRQPRRPIFLLERPPKA